MRDLLDLIDELPAHSRFREALQNDPDYAAAVAAAEEANRGLSDSKPAWTPKVADYNLAAIQRNDIRELLVQLIDVTLTGTNRKPSNSPRFPVPHTAVDDAREDLRRQGYAVSLAVFAPHATPIP